MMSRLGIFDFVTLDYSERSEHPGPQLLFRAMSCAPQGWPPGFHNPSL